MAAIPASHRDMIDAPWAASLSTVGADGTPQVTAPWYLALGAVVCASVIRSRQKYRNVLAGPNFAGQCCITAWPQSNTGCTTSEYAA